MDKQARSVLDEPRADSVGDFADGGAGRNIESFSVEHLSVSRN
jgi:hypothetical protein